MLLNLVNAQAADKVFVVVRNMAGETISGNAAVAFDCGTTVDGVSAIKPAAGSFLGWVGIADADIANTGYGLAQAWGYRDSCLLSHEGTSVTVTIGDALHVVAGVYGLNTSTVQALSTTASRYVVCAATTTISAAAYCKGIIRCL